MLAGYLHIPFVDADDFHPPANIEKMRAGIPLDDEDRAGWLTNLNAFALEMRKKGSVVIACSALKEKYRVQLRQGIPDNAVKWIHLQGDWALIHRRMAARNGHFMPPALLQSQFDSYEPPTEGMLLDVADTPENILQNILINMQLLSEWGIAGLGVMGRNLARNLARNGISLSLFNRFVAGKEEKVAEKAVITFPELAHAKAFESLPEFVASLARPRKIFLMVNAGAAVDDMLVQLEPLLSPGDIIMDGGNSHFADTRRRQQQAKNGGYHFLGVGVSGGESGALYGPAVMAGGEPEAWRLVAPFLEKIAAKDASGGACAALAGPDGAGHFVKMAHNGIEYAEMQLLAEAYSVLRWELGHTPDEVADVMALWAEDGLHSYLLEITIQILRRKEGDGWLLDVISDKASHKGTGSWTSIAASELGVPLTLTTEALLARFVASMRDERRGLSEFYAFKAEKLTIITDELKDAYRLARIINHQQGFQLIQAASKAYGWSVRLPELARIWTNGCIIRSELMAAARQILLESDDFLRHDTVVQWIRAGKPALQQTVSALGHSHRAYPCLMSALSALNALTTAHSAAHLIQAQRDYFGAHLYERTDDPSGKKYHTDWER